MAAGTIPVWEELWLEGDGEALKLSNSHEKVSGGEHVITGIDSDNWTNLEFPLTWHDLSIGTRDSETSIKAALVMSISNGSSKANVATNGAVVWSLVGWVTIRWPSVWVSLELVLVLQNGILLLNTEPWDLFLVGIENFLSEVSEVSVGWHEIGVGGVAPDICLTKNHDVVATSEGVWEEECWLHDNLGIFRGSLIAR